MSYPGREKTGAGKEIKEYGKATLTERGSQKAGATKSDLVFLMVEGNNKKLRPTKLLSKNTSKVAVKRLIPFATLSTFEAG